MVNDITTLNGSLMELGETLATNITAKGVSASASDGLTTLANKVLQISGGGGSTVLFEDACSSATGLSDYGTGIPYERSATPTITYDSTENAYKIQTGGNVAMTPIPTLEDVNDFVFEADIKRQTAQMGVGVALGYHYGQGSAYSSTTLGCWLFVNGSFQNLGDTSAPNTTGEWCHIRYTLEDGIYGTCVFTTDNNTQYTKTFTLPNDYANGHSVGLVSGASGYCYVKNIKVESLGGGSDCSQYTTQINNAIEYINGDGT